MNPREGGNTPRERRTHVAPPPPQKSPKDHLETRWCPQHDIYDQCPPEAASGGVNAGVEAVRAGEGVPRQHPHLPTPNDVALALRRRRRSLPARSSPLATEVDAVAAPRVCSVCGGYGWDYAVSCACGVCGGRAQLVVPAVGGWRQEELALRATLGDAPPGSDTVAWATHAAEFAAGLFYLSIYPEGVLGVQLWADAERSKQLAAEVAALAAAERDPITRAADASRRAAIEAELAERVGDDDAEDEAEWRVQDAQAEKWWREARARDGHDAAGVEEDLMGA